tara:strand:- start:5461 stop:6348 length:888 start_codon:yes stop_codon:yes gene_type:complete
VKKKILIITSYKKNFGYGNLNRSYNFYNYIKKKFSAKIYVKTSSKNFFLLVKKYKKIDFFKMSQLVLNKSNCNLFLDAINLTQNEIKKMKFFFKSSFFYGDSNYFLFNKHKFLTFKRKNIYHSIVDTKIKNANYKSIKKIIFFLYFSSHFNRNVVIKFLETIRSIFPNKIKIFISNKKYNNFFIKKFKNIEITNKLFEMKKNHVYISNSGSGAIDRLNKGYISINFSKTKNERELALNLKKINKSFYYIGDIDNISHSLFLRYLKKIKNFRYPYKSNSINFFKNNNKNLEKKILI